jgi:sec-independent protein translocase protein TatC
LLASPIMFIVGATFAYFIILPFAFAFFLGFEDTFKAAMEGSSLASAPAGVVYQGSVEAYLSLTMTFVMAFGLCFQLPVLLTLLGKAGILTAAGLKATRKYAIVAILFVAAVVTPPDVMSQLILFAAVYPLYEISIFLISRFERQREAEERANGTWVDEDTASDD